MAKQKTPKTEQATEEAGKTRERRPARDVVREQINDLAERIHYDPVRGLSARLLGLKDVDRKARVACVDVLTRVLKEAREAVDVETPGRPSNAPDVAAALLA